MLMMLCFQVSYVNILIFDSVYYVYIYICVCVVIHKCVYISVYECLVVSSSNLADATEVLGYQPITGICLELAGGLNTPTTGFIPIFCWSIIWSNMQYSYIDCVYMYMYMYIYTYYILIYYIYMYIHTYTHVYVCIYVYTYIYI